MSEPRCCERCGVALSETEPWGGACPRCMLELGIESAAESSDNTLAVSGLGANVGVADSPGVIGRYRILRRIGEGGMGVVYEAEQDHPRRTVALKIIRPGLATPELLRRFEQESQALGRLQHAGIAQIYEAGTADTGLGPQPYFAMEFIRGKSLKDYAEAHHLSTQQRLEMIVKVAEAVHHAHQRGLIHRDLKPANIIVDEAGQPKILDFGVARATDSDSQATTHTDLGQLVGTLAYMSPEQVLADPLELDTRSDVYSLGVILYELLAGSLPYTISKKLPETIHAIREEDPAKLSAVSRTYRGDIETIVAKALEKDRSRRYGSASELAADIRRYLKDEPIVARPPSTSYQLQKFARRHKALVGGIAAVFIVLAGGVVVSTAYAVRASRSEIIARNAEIIARKERYQAAVERERADQNAKEASSQRDRAVALEGEANTERDKAIAEKQRADTEAETAKAVQEFLGNDLLRNANPILQAQSFQSGQLAPPSNPNITVKEVLDRASGNIAGKFDKKPLVESAIRETIAETYYGMGLYESAREHFEKARALRSREQGPDNLDTLKTTMRLAETLSRLHKWQEFEPLIKQVIEAGQRGPGDDNPATQSAIRLLINNYLSARYVGDPNIKAWQKKPLVEELLKSMIVYDRQKLGDENPATQLAISGLLVLYKIEQPQRIAVLEAFLKPLYEDQLARRGASDPITRNTMNELMSLYMSQTPRRLAEAEGLLKSLVQDSRRRLGDDNPASIAAVTQLVSFYTAPPGRYAQAEAFLRPIVDDQRRRLGDGNRATLSSLNLLVRVQMTQPQPRYAEVESFLKSIRDDQVRKLGSGSRAAMNSTNQLASLYLRQTRFTEAEGLLVPIVTDSAVNKLLEGGRNIFTEQSLLLDSMDLLSQVYSRQGNSQQADALAKKLGNVMAVALKSSLASTAGTENLATPLMTMLNLAAGYARQGRDADADELISTVLEGYRSVARTDPKAREIASTLTSMAPSAYGSRGQIAKAEQLVKAVLDIQHSELGDGDPATMDTLRDLGELYARQRKFADAQDTFKRLIAIQGQALGPLHPETRRTMGRLWVLYTTEYRFFKAQGQREEAMQAARKSIPFIMEFLDLDRSSPGNDLANEVGLLTISLTTVNVIAGNYAEAEDLWSQSMGRRRAAGTLTPDATAVLGWLQFLQGKYSSAETAFRDTCPPIQVPLQRPNCQSMLGAVLAAQKKFEEAEPILLQSHEQMRFLAVRLPQAIDIQDFILEQVPGERILKLYEDWGKPEKVAEWQQKLQEQKAAVSPRVGGVPLPQR